MFAREHRDRTHALLYEKGELSPIAGEGPACELDDHEQGGLPTDLIGDF